jgi:hypothetical protein
MRKRCGSQRVEFGRGWLGGSKLIRLKLGWLKLGWLEFGRHWLNRH